MTPDPTPEEVERALAYFYENYVPTPEVIWSGLDSAASMGIDISEAPYGSIARISKEGVTFHLLDDEGYPI